MPGKRIRVAPERLAGWLDRFAGRHGPTTWSASPEQVRVQAADGATAVCHVPFPPLAVHADLPYGGLVEHALAERRVGVLLVRRGGHAAGVFAGTRLVSSKVGSRLVQGRSAAGGWSQQRFARRRAGQARQAMEAAADVAVRILLGEALDAVVVGGDRRAVEQVLADARLAPIVPLVRASLWGVPDPRLETLRSTPALYRAVTVDIGEPA